MREPLWQAREYFFVKAGFPLPLGHCGTTKDSAINEAGLMIKLEPLRCPRS